MFLPTPLGSRQDGVPVRVGVNGIAQFLQKSIHQPPTRYWIAQVFREVGQRVCIFLYGNGRSPEFHKNTLSR